MPKIIKKPVNVIRAVTLLCGWKVTAYQESEPESKDSFAMIQIVVYQDAERPYGNYWLRAASEGNSLCLFVNPSPTTMDDQLLTGYRNLDQAFAKISNAYHEAGGSLTDKLTAVEAVLVSSGLLDSVFA